jgi:hypothetical protein
MSIKSDKSNSSLLSRLLKGKTRSESGLVVKKQGKKRAGRIIEHEGRQNPDIPKRKRGESILVEDTRTMERKRRLVEQNGHRKFAKVHAREHNEEESTMAPEGELQNSIQQHPWLNSPRFDGIDPNLNPEPPLNTEARREFDNERREQEMEKQLRLGNMPKMSTAPKPRP